MESTSTKKIVILIVLAALVIGVAYLLANGTQRRQSGSDQNQGQQAQDEDVAFSRQDLETLKSSETELFKGLPADLPIEQANVKDKYEVEYKDINATQYTVTYSTDLSTTAAYNQYTNYMTSAGFQFNEGGQISPTSDADGYLSGSKDNDDLVVSVYAQEGVTQVQISYLDRK